MFSLKLLWRSMICIWNFSLSQNSLWKCPMICKYFSFCPIPCISSTWKVLVFNISHYYWYQLFLFSKWSVFPSQRTFTAWDFGICAWLQAYMWICTCFQSEVAKLCRLLKMIYCFLTNCSFYIFSLRWLMLLFFNVEINVASTMLILSVLSWQQNV